MIADQIINLPLLLGVGGGVRYNYVLSYEERILFIAFSPQFSYYIPSGVTAY